MGISVVVFGDSIADSRIKYAADEVIYATSVLRFSGRSAPNYRDPSGEKIIFVAGDVLNPPISEVARLLDEHELVTVNNTDVGLPALFGIRRELYRTPPKLDLSLSYMLFELAHADMLAKDRVNVVRDLRMRIMLSPYNPDYYVMQLRDMSRIIRTLGIGMERLNRLAKYPLDDSVVWSYYFRRTGLGNCETMAYAFLKHMQYGPLCLCTPNGRLDAIALALSLWRREVYTLGRSDIVDGIVVDRCRGDAVLAEETVPDCEFKAGFFLFRDRVRRYQDMFGRGDVYPCGQEGMLVVSRG